MFIQGLSGGSTDLVLWLRINLEKREDLGVRDTGATVLIVAKMILLCGDLKHIMPTAAICMGEGHVGIVRSTWPWDLGAFPM